MQDRFLPVWIIILIGCVMIWGIVHTQKTLHTATSILSSPQASNLASSQHSNSSTIKLVKSTIKLVKVKASPTPNPQLVADARWRETLQTAAHTICQTKEQDTYPDVIATTPIITGHMPGRVILRVSCGDIEVKPLPNGGRMESISRAADDPKAHYMDDWATVIRGKE